MTDNFPLTIYYDKSCPMCREEIHAIKRADRHDRLRLYDCSAPDFSDPSLAAANISQQDLLTAMHVRDAEGNWFKAVDAFVQVYSAVGLESLSRVWANTRLKPLWDRLYPFVAHHRMKLSRLGLHKFMRWFINRAAQRAENLLASCDQTSCQRPPNE